MYLFVISKKGKSLPCLYKLIDSVVGRLFRIQRVAACHTYRRKYNKKWKTEYIGRSIRNCWPRAVPLHVCVAKKNRKIHFLFIRIKWRYRISLYGDCIWSIGVFTVCTSLIQRLHAHLRPDENGFRPWGKERAWVSAFVAVFQYMHVRSKRSSSYTLRPERFVKPPSSVFKRLLFFLLCRLLRLPCSLHSIFTACVESV